MLTSYGNISRVKSTSEKSEEVGLGADLRRSKLFCFRDAVLPAEIQIWG